MPTLPPATPPTVAAEIAAAVAIVIFMCWTALQLANTYAQVVNVIHALSRAGVPVRGAKSGPVGGGAAPLLGQATQTGGSRLLPVPAFNQLTDVTVSPAAAWTAPVDCGPECVAMGIYAVRGVETVAELLRLRVFGVIDARLTSAPELQAMYKLNHIQTQVIAPAPSDLTRRLQEALTKGHLVHVLGNWLTSSMSHWHTVRGLAADGVVIEDPWGGMQRTYPLAEYLQLYQHSALEVLEPAKY